jgi:uncharacterized repeat protein (TIGR03803 family)
MVTNTLQPNTSKMRRGSAGAALAVGLVLVLGNFAAPSAPAQTFTDLYKFRGGANGAAPYAGLVRDAAGNLYGTTELGGDPNCGYEPGCGTVFKLSKTGKETVLHTFSYSDGASPQAVLIRDAAGNLYGTAFGGGSYACSGGCGIVFKLSETGTLTVLHTFFGGTSDGCWPYGGLIRDKSGNLYGTTSGCGFAGFGTVFKVSQTGTEVVLHSFAGSDGQYPFLTSLLRDRAGNLYGNTYWGGSFGEGVVYKLSPSGTLTVVHSFEGGTKDGCWAYGTPAMDSHGNLYGTTTKCGPKDLGIVWKVSQTGTETILHKFTGYPSDGAWPYAGVILDANGNLYGTTEIGGSSNYGTVFKLRNTGQETILHSFSDGSDGGAPFGGVILDPMGNLDGTAVEGGLGNGTVWKLTP